jgi:tRNA (cmo5U34)-methyltransferase
MESTTRLYKDDFYDEDTLIDLKTGLPIDKTQPEGKWEFNAEVAECFDNMLERSIPDYDTMRELCFDIGSRYVKPYTFIVDLGCSRGEALAPYVKCFGTNNRYIGVEVSQPMIDAAKERFGNLAHPEDCATVSIVNCDLRQSFPLPVLPHTGWEDRQASVVMSVLTLQFTPIEYRKKKLALEGVLVPVTARWNEELLQMSGFKEVDCFWRNRNFAAWIAVK